MKSYGCHSMTLPLRRVIVKKPEDAFRDEARIDAQWKDLNYLGRPGLASIRPNSIGGLRAS